MPGTTMAQRSVYCRALANGITEVLEVYRSAVLQVEQSLMRDPVPVLAAVTQGLYQEMLPEYISLQVAESILFVGKALQVLRNPSLTFESQVDVIESQWNLLQERIEASKDFTELA